MNRLNVSVILTFSRFAPLIYLMDKVLHEPSAHQVDKLMRRTMFWPAHATVASHNTTTIAIVIASSGSSFISKCIVRQ